MNVSVESVLHDNGALRAALKAMRKPVAPPALTTSLRVLASRERQRAAARRSLAARYEVWADRARLAMHNLMRPLALPFAGGVFSAATLFSLWVAPAYPVLAHGGGDVPTGLHTAAAVKFTSPLGMSNADIVVDVLVDEQGRMVEYSVLSGNLDVRSRRNLENALMFTEFVPATTFGRPALGRVRVWLNSSRIDVKG